MPSPEWQLDYYRHWIHHYLSVVLTMTRMTATIKIAKDGFKSFFSGLMRLNWGIAPTFVHKHLQA